MVLLYTRAAHAAPIPWREEYPHPQVFSVISSVIRGWAPGIHSTVGWTSNIFQAVLGVLTDKPRRRRPGEVTRSHVDSANPLEPDGVECNLQAALASLENDRPAAIQQVEAFINQVEALPGTKWTNAEAEELVTKPEEIIAAIEALL